MGVNGWLRHVVECSGRVEKRSIRTTSFYSFYFLQHSTSKFFFSDYVSLSPCVLVLSNSSSFLTPFLTCVPVSVWSLSVCSPFCHCVKPAHLCFVFSCFILVSVLTCILFVFLFPFVSCNEPQLWSHLFPFPSLFCVNIYCLSSSSWLCPCFLLIFPL